MTDRTGSKRTNNSSQSGDSASKRINSEIATLVKRRASTRLSPEMVREKNSRLIRALRGTAAAMSLDTKDLASVLEIEYNQLNACYTGFRDFAYISPAQRKNIARFLGIPALQVALWCGLITLEEFISPQDADTKVNQIFFTNIVTDQEIATISPSEKAWLEASDEMRIAYTLLYQAYNQRWLMNRVVVDEKEMTRLEEEAGIQPKPTIGSSVLQRMTAEEHFQSHSTPATRSKKSGFSLSPVINKKIETQKKAELMKQVRAFQNSVEEPAKPMAEVFNEEEVARLNKSLSVFKTDDETSET